MRNHTLFLLLVLIGAFFRFFNLNWGAPFYFHPDERNIASAVSQLQFPDQLNPHFFAYGSLPIYAIYFTGVLLNKLSTLNSQLSISTNVSFEMAIIISRFFSALLSTLLIILVYIAGKKIKDETTGRLASFLTITSVGLIQYAHFGTFEMWLTFFSFLLFLLSHLITGKGKLRHMVSAAVTTGLLLATKVSGVVLIPFLILPVFIHHAAIAIKGTLAKNYFIAAVASIFIVIIAFGIAAVASPYNIIDFSSFRSTIMYESAVALGTIPVFYTQAFYDTKPIIFQFLFVYPFLLNPFLTMLAIPSFLYVAYVNLRQKNIGFTLLFLFFSFLFFSQAFLFAKWTRYIVPTLPFLYVIIAITFTSLPFEKKYVNRLIRLLAVVSIFYTSAFLISTYFRPDTRIAASMWAKDHIPPSAQILSEVYDLGITPFNNYFSSITLFNFYELDQNQQKENELTQAVKTSEYIVIPSQRILKTRGNNKKQFPKGYAFYTSLTDTSKFERIYETPCDIFCYITYMGRPYILLEETTSVFDRPTVFIFKKVK